MKEKAPTPSKKEQKSDLSAAHFEQHYNATTSRTDLCKYTTFKLGKQLNPIGAMKTYTKSNCKLCTEERLMVLRNIRDKHVTVMNNNSEIFRACRQKTTFNLFFLSTDDTALTGERVRPYKGF